MTLDPSATHEARMYDARAGSGSASSEMLNTVSTGVLAPSTTRSAIRGKWAMTASECRITAFSSVAAMTVRGLRGPTP